MSKPSYSHIEIRSTQKGHPFTELYIDGHKVRGVRRYELVHEAGGMPVLKLDLNALAIDTDQYVLMYDHNSMQGMNITWRDDDILSAPAEGRCEDRTDSLA